nr:MAG TPA: hypothetical protein [Bacteriophage sp.]
MLAFNCKRLWIHNTFKQWKGKLLWHLTLPQSLATQRA